MAARVHRGVEDGHAARLVGGRDSIRIDEGLTVAGVRKVLHAVLADALGELEGRRLLRGSQFGAQRARWLQGLARGNGLPPHRGAHTDPIRRELARRVWVWKVADAVGAHALGELHRLLTGGAGAPMT